MDAHLKTLIDELVSLSEKATPGPWESGEGVCGPFLDYQAREPEWDVNYSGREPLWLGGSVRKEDRDFIAALRNAFPAIVSALSDRDRVRAEALTSALEKILRITESPDVTVFKLIEQMHDINSIAASVRW